MTGYQGKHAKRPSRDELPPALRGLADLIVIVESENGETS